VRVSLPRLGASGGSAGLCRCSLAATLLAVASSFAPGVAFSDVATPGDVTACNEQARGAATGRGASPNAEDKARAADARDGRRDATREHTDHTGTITRSGDPQIDGMDAAGARDEAYRAAYRVCMRQKGF